MQVAAARRMKNSDLSKFAARRSFPRQVTEIVTFKAALNWSTVNTFRAHGIQPDVAFAGS